MKLDYLSFTLDGAGEEIRNAVDVYWIASNLVKRFASADHWSYIKGGDDFIPAIGRAPYKWSVRRMDGGVSIFGSDARDEILIEMTGRACDELRLYDEIEMFILPLIDRVTRIDLAIDYETDVQPDEFVAAGYSKRFKSSSSMRSGSGHTEYIGSAKSDLMARVYRYKAPHPRSKYLRVEHVFRRARAKACAEWICHGMLDQTADQQLLATFGWQHDLAARSAGHDAIPTQSVERSAQGRIYWLYKQVAPALAQACIDDERFYEGFLQEVQKHWERLTHSDNP